MKVITCIMYQVFGKTQGDVFSMITCVGRWTVKGTARVTLKRDKPLGALGQHRCRSIAHLQTFSNTMIGKEHDTRVPAETQEREKLRCAACC
jgi:hypothetical protein